MSEADRWKVKEGDAFPGARKWNALIEWIASGRLIPGQSTGLSVRQGIGGTTISLKDDGGGGLPLFCSPTGGIAGATGVPGTGSPGGGLANQTIYQIIDGQWAEYDTGATVYNPMQNTVLVTATLIVLENNDGTYTAINQDCPT